MMMIEIIVAKITVQIPMIMTSKIILILVKLFKIIAGKIKANIMIKNIAVVLMIILTKRIQTKKIIMINI